MFFREVETNLHTQWMKSLFQQRKLNGIKKANVLSFIRICLYVPISFFQFLLLPIPCNQHKKFCKVVNPIYTEIQATSGLDFRFGFWKSQPSVYVLKKFVQVSQMHSSPSGDLRSPFSFFKFSCALRNRLVSSRTPCTVTSSREGLRTLLPTASWYLSYKSPWKIPPVKPWMQQCFTHRQKRESKICFNSGCWSLTGDSWQPTQANLFTYARLVPQWKEPSPSSQTTDAAVRLAKVRMMLTRKQNKREYFGLTKEKAISHEMISLAQAV